ncbi:Spy/CpxP family protein refolding chaperone [Methylovirgula sp. 4M-Z18]|uniref:Spy/CpxP family protein refolding chaperone n=1 Tax=Methylovirgula sp. 4M-Z18 TaxID=2293567 RepID=UPI000E2FDD3E|nr:Spy/CpxP family protein refolding chaperone [Methylovirgula sp. 4M-Z18]RFB80601.1 hypothetical protein DYH55_03615 [Methylovirgula sp. 4M-Z18]
MTKVFRALFAAVPIVAICAGFAFAQMGPAPVGFGHGNAMLGRLCNPTTPPFPADKVAARLTEMLKLTDAQKPALKDLEDSVAKAIEDTKSLCLEKPDMTSLPGRAAFAAKRMTVMAAAINSVQPKLEAFYNTLDDKQKAAFNEMHGPGMMRRWGHHHEQQGDDEDEPAQP